MSGWQKADMTDGGNALAQSDRLDHAVTAYAISVHGQLPAGFGVFAFYDIETKTDTWFFSPEAAVIAPIFGAQPCEKPTPEEGFGLLAGSASSGELHFSDHFSRR